MQRRPLAIIYYLSVKIWGKIFTSYNVNKNFCHNRNTVAPGTLDGLKRGHRCGKACESKRVIQANNKQPHRTCKFWQKGRNIEQKVTAERESFYSYHNEIFFPCLESSAVSFYAIWVCHLQFYILRNPRMYSVVKREAPNSFKPFRNSSSVLCGVIYSKRAYISCFISCMCIIMIIMVGCVVANSKLWTGEKESWVLLLCLGWKG